MVIMMSSGRIRRYKEEAKADMIRCNRSQIRCPCRRCKLVRWIDPDSGQLEDHLLRHGFMLEQDHHHDEGDAGGQDHHHDEGDAGGQDHHDEEDAGGQDHHHDEGDADGGANTQTPLTSALQDAHVQELLLKDTSNARAAAREKASWRKWR